MSQVGIESQTQCRREAAKTYSVCLDSVSQGVTVWVWNVRQKLACWAFDCQLRHYFGRLWNLEDWRSILLVQISHAFEGYTWSLVPSVFVRVTALSILSHCHDVLPKYMGPRHNGWTLLKPLNCSPTILVITVDTISVCKLSHRSGWEEHLLPSCRGPGSVPSTHFRQPTTIFKSSSRDPTSFLAFEGTSTHVVHTHTHLKSINP